MADRVRWGILGTANIARASFLPGLRAAGGEPWAVAGRDRSRTEAYAREQGIAHAVLGYDELLDRADVDAVYIPLPNSLHKEWVIRALRAGKPVLCEKPLGLTAAEVSEMTAVSEQTGVPLWEAFVFMFRPHFEKLQGWVRDGAIGTLSEVDSRFSFRIRNTTNIRLQPELGGGALYDVGCYPLHLASRLNGQAAKAATVKAMHHPSGVDETVAGLVEFPEARLLFSASLNGAPDTFTRLTGSEGSVACSNPFHPGDRDLLALTRRGETTVLSAGDGRPSFAAAIAHVQRVVQGEEAARLTAAETSLDTAVTIDLIRGVSGLAS